MSCPCISEIEHVVPVAALAKLINEYTKEYSPDFIIYEINAVPRYIGMKLEYEPYMRTLIWKDIDNITEINCDPNCIIPTLDIIIKNVNNTMAIGYLDDIARILIWNMKFWIQRCHHLTRNS